MQQCISPYFLIKFYALKKERASGCSTLEHQAIERLTGKLNKKYLLEFEQYTITVDFYLNLLKKGNKTV
jgi:hypothetical protein